MERADCGRLGLPWKPRAKLASRCDRGPGGWRLLQERGARCSGLGGSGAGSGEAEKGAGFWVRSLEAFPQGKKAIFLTLLSNLLSRAE